jgi:hypothetical protein
VGKDNTRKREGIKGCCLIRVNKDANTANKKSLITVLFLLFALVQPFFPSINEVVPVLLAAGGRE